MESLTPYFVVSGVSNAAFEAAARADDSVDTLQRIQDAETRTVYRATRGDDVESLAGEEIEPGIGRTFTSAGYPDDTYRVAVEDDSEGLPAWKQTTRWSNLAECPSLVFELRLTNRNGVRNVVPSERCESA